MGIEYIGHDSGSGQDSGIIPFATLLSKEPHVAFKIPLRKPQRPHFSKATNKWHLKQLSSFNAGYKPKAGQDWNPGLSAPAAGMGQTESH